MKRTLCSPQVLLWTTLFIFFCFFKKYFLFFSIFFKLILILFLFLFIFRLICLFSFMLFRKSIWNDDYFLIVHLIFEEIFMINLYFFNLLYRQTLFLKIKINLFSNNISNMSSLTYYFFLLFYLINLICVSIFIIVWLNKKIILIKKFNKYNRVNVKSYEIKYFNLHSSLLIFPVFIFSHYLWFFFTY
jgi:hypothetical protein